MLHRRCISLVVALFLVAPFLFVAWVTMIPEARKKVFASEHFFGNAMTNHCCCFHQISTEKNNKQPKWFSDEVYMFASTLEWRI